MRKAGALAVRRRAAGFERRAHPPAQAKSRAILHDKRGRAASPHPQQVSSIGRTARPGLSMTGCESRRGDAGACPAEALAKAEAW
jgi:hypothetical protein